MNSQRFMKTPLLYLLLLGAAPLSAQFTGSDDFASETKNATKWGADISGGSGQLTQAGGFVRYTSAGLTDDDFMAWPWIVGTGPLDQNWSIQADVHVPIIALPEGFAAAGIGIGVRNSNNPDDTFTLALENERSPGQAQQFNYFNGIDIGGDGNETNHPASGQDGAVRISWNAATRTLTAEFDADGAVNGYQWIPFNSFNPFSGGWLMGPETQLEIFLLGASENIAVTEDDNVHADNFAVALTTPANLFGADNFNDDARDPTKWGTNDAQNTGLLNEVSGRLEYTGQADIEPFGYAERPWILNTGSYTEDWEARVDVHVDAIPMGVAGDRTQMVLAVYGNDHTGEIQLELEHDGANPQRRFRSTTDGDIGETTANTTTTDGALRISFNAAQKVLTFAYDANGPVGGYSWTTLKTLDVDAPASDWLMAETSRFSLAIFGEHEGVTVEPGEAWADNFEATSALPSVVAGTPTGTENFAGAAKDGSKWGANLKSGAGQLTQTGGVLQYTSTATSEDDFMAWPWLVSAPFASDWSVQTDVHLPWIPLADDFTAVGVGLFVSHSADMDDNFSAMLENYRYPGAPQSFHFFNEESINDEGDETFVDAPSSHAAVRVSWDAASQTLSAAYDPDGRLNGYTWTVFRTFNPVTQGWGMTGTGSFKIHLGAYSETTAVTAAHGVHADNFRTFGLPGNPIAPVVKTLAATGIGFDGATLNGSVDAKGSERDVFFDYGTTTAFGMSVPALPASVDGGGAQSVSAVIGGLLPHTKYFFRTRAEGLLGTASATPLSFTTANRNPTGSNDSFTVLPGSVVVLNVLDNDVDPDGDPLALTSVTAPAAGAKVKKTGNTVLLTTAAGFNAPNGFTYKLADAFGGSAQASVALVPGTLELDLATQDDLTSAGGSYDVVVTANGLWSVAAPAWVRAEPAAGNGSTTVTLSVQPNTGTKPRTGTVFIGGVAHTVTQAGVLKPALAMPADVPGGIVSGNYDLLIPVENLPVVFSIKNLPPGLTANGATGSITGKPLKAGDYNVEIRAKNAAGSADEVLTFDIYVAALDEGLVGLFHGLVDPHADHNGKLGSRLELTVASTGAVSGKAVTGTVASPFKGQLDASANDPEHPVCRLSVPRKGLPPLQVEVQFDATEGTLAGNVYEDDPGENAAVEAWRNPWKKLGPTPSDAGFAGPHSFRLIQNDADPGLPQGDGFGSFTVSTANGSLSLAGKTGDGAAFVGKTFIGQEGQVLLYQALYAKRGSLAGVLQVNAGATPADNTVGGDARWFKPDGGEASKDTLYPRGLDLTLDVDGGGYPLLEKGDLVMGLTPGNNNALLEFSAGGLDGDGFDQLFTVVNPSATGITNKAVIVKDAGANPNRVKVAKFDAKTGALAGEFWIGARKAPWFGQLVQSGGEVRGHGFFVLPETAGSGAQRLSGRLFLTAPE